MSEHPSRDPDRDLWERSAPAGAPRDACPAPDTLAAWAEGRASGAEREAVETHLAECPDCRGAVRDVRLAAGSGTLPFVPPAVLDAARGLVAARPLPRRGWRLAGEWGMAAAASVAVCLLAWRTGTGMLPARTLSEDEVLGEMTFGLLVEPVEPGGDPAALLLPPEVSR